MRIGNGRMAWAGMAAAALAATGVGAADVQYYECTFQQLREGVGDLVLVVGVENGQIVRNALLSSGQPDSTCEMETNDLKADGRRLRGSMQVRTGRGLDKIALDVALDQGGTYTLTYGCPDPSRTVTEKVSIELPKSADPKRYVIWLAKTFGMDTRLALVLNIDRAAKKVEAVQGWASGYNKGNHPLDIGGLTFDGTNLEGEVGITVVAAGIPDHGQPTAGRIRLKASLDGGDNAGEYTATLGIEKQRQGEVTAKAATIDRLRTVRAHGAMPAASDADGVLLVGRYTPWRVYLTHTAAGKDATTPLPPVAWTRADFDDSCWARYQDDLGDFMTADALGKVRLHLRTCFGIADPAKATDLKLSLPFAGGETVWVNGASLGGADKVNIPAASLVKGRNVLAVELNRAVPAAGGGDQKVGGVRGIKVNSASGAGVIPYAEAIVGTRVWSANAVDEVAETLATRSLIGRNWFWCMLWGRGMPVKGVQQGNPFDPVLPVKMTMPRNGVGSGQVVLSDPDGLQDVTAVLDPLKGPGGAAIPASGVEIRFAVQHPRVHFCDALMETPPANARTVPVWLVVQAPKNQAPGWYASTLRLSANGREFDVPVRVLVTGFVLPDARDLSPVVNVTHSPATVARQYQVELWSDEHWKRMEKSFALMAQVGNDTLHVPVIVSGVGGAGKSGFNFRWEPLIRWVKDGDKLKPDYSLLERYLDTYTKYCAPPQGLSLYIWGYSSAKELADAYENRRIASRENVTYSPAKVLVWDPATRTGTEHLAPPFGDPGCEEFWKPMLEGVRALVVKRGWSERIVMLGLGGDIRPGQKTCDLLKQWAPYARWDFLSHFSGDPAPSGGKMIATGAMEVGMKEYPGQWVLTPVELEAKIRRPDDFLDLPTARWFHQEFSSPYLFRTLTATWGNIGRMGLDFWQAGKGGPQNTSFFNHVNALSVPGPDGAVPTVQFQMLREGTQDAEIRTAVIRAYLKLPEEQQKPYRAMLGEMNARMGYGYPMVLGDQELSYDWLSYVARLHEAAAELAGVKTDAKWDAPPK